MGLSMEDLATITPYFFFLKVAGFKELKKAEETNFRKLGYMVFKMNADPKKSRGVSMNDVWPSMYEEEDVKPKELFNKQQVAAWAKVYKKRKQNIK